MPRMKGPYRHGLLVVFVDVPCPKRAKVSKETVWWGCSAARRRYKAAAFGSGSSLTTNFHYFIEILAVKHTPQVKEEMKRSGGDTVPRGGNIRRPPLTMGPLLPRISTIHIGILAVKHTPQVKEELIKKRCGGDALPLEGDTKRSPLAVGPVMPRISTIHISILANETEWWGYCATWGKYKAAALTVGPVMPRISTTPMSILAVRMLRKMKRSGGDTVPHVK
ncbi:hypothetical protein HZH68_012709 [Vespula germanica]|uniref:Uncharacterized protein n=1 Tax=Vespula germanica TaxID=30212 RepID=A0A834MVM2_VESGE|nr:hypothetical protein HZH68_012709 [Vespula germanica]